MAANGEPALAGNAGSALAGSGGLFDPTKNPLRVRVAAVNGNDVTLAWDNPPPDDIEGWRFMVYDRGQPEFTFSLYNQVPTRVTLKRMRANDTHEFIVTYKRSGDHSNENVSPPNSPVRLQLLASPDSTPPTAPPNAHQVFDPALYELTSFWDPSTDNVTPQADLQYDLVDNFSGFTFHYGATSPVTAWLSATSVRAVDAAGNRSPLSRLA